MKKGVIIFFTLIFCKSVFAQQQDTAIAVITYAFSHIRDTTNLANPYTENMNLFLGKRSSLYKTADKEVLDSIAMANFRASGGTVFAPSRLYTFSEYYFFQDKHQFFDMERYFSYYIMKDEWPIIQWKITDETKKIAQLNCQKAIGEWRGRTYEAWFCTDLPYHAGPWKLNGLPGLIVEAHDTKKQIVFRFAGYKTLNDGKIIIALPQKGKAKETTIDDYSKLREAGRQNPGGVASAATDGRVLMNTTRPAVKGINNPMELNKL